MQKEAINYYNDGVKAQKDNKELQMKDFYTKTLYMDPNNEEFKKWILHNYGVLYAKQGDLARAEETFLQVLQMDPNYMPARKDLGLVYDKTHSRLEAIEYWLKILEIDLDKLKPQDYILAEEQKQ